METAQKKHITHPPRLRKALEDITHTPNPFVFFFKIWQLLRVINNEGTEVSKDIQAFTDMEQWFQKDVLLGIFYDVFWGESDEYKIIKNSESRKKSRKRLFRLKTEAEWKKLPFKNGILSRFPDILDPNKTGGYDRLQRIRDYYREKGLPQLKDLLIEKNGEWEIIYDLSEDARREIFEQNFSDVHILRKILTYGKRNDLRKKEDHRCPYYERIDPVWVKTYVEGGIENIDAETGKVIEEYYDAYGKEQYTLRMEQTLDSLYRTFQPKCREVERKKAVSHRDGLQMIVSVADSVFSPLLLSLVTNRLAHDIKGHISRAEIEQYAYLLSNTCADSYDEYLAVNRFFSQLLVSMDVRGNFLRHLFQYIFWAVFWLLSCIFVPLVFSGIFAAAILGFPSGNIEVARWGRAYMKEGFSIVVRYALLVCVIAGVLMIAGDFSAIQHHGANQRIDQTIVQDFLSSLRSDVGSLKSSILEATGSLFGSRGAENECARVCYSLSCVIEKGDCTSDK